MQVRPPAVELAACWAPWDPLYPFALSCCLLFSTSSERASNHVSKLAHVYSKIGAPSGSAWRHTSVVAGSESAKSYGTQPCMYTELQFRVSPLKAS